MRATLAKHWFLLILGLGLGTAWLQPELLRPGVERLQARVLVTLALFLIAWGLETRQLARALLRPQAALWAVFISYALIPALAWIARGLLDDADLRVGLVIVASVPCTLASAVLWTRLAGGNEAVALLVVLLTTGTSWLVTTLWVTLGTGTQVGVDTAGMMASLFLVLVLPVALSQLSRSFGPLARAVTHHRQALGVVSQLLILAIILKAAVELHGRFDTRPAAFSLGSLLGVAALTLAVHLAGLCAGFWTSKAWRFDRASQIAVAFAGSQKTLPVALFLFEAYFKDAYPLAVVPMVFYHVGQLIVDTPIARALAAKAAEESLVAAEAGV